ncbi:FecR domain-containing protein [Rhizobium sp. 16-449-1b]|uniref:FecR family protein n=1 Tax=Rhizobium sp. 16-449-1b TaxID=2819989 RepID=UPI001ADBB23B|nr:FecR domain-containing protein [Rhizobium sp. 16-449-1b]MBO9195242.1 FecR domain-containing protein [Rhizobium sp. 16-449-1b]
MNDLPDKGKDAERTHEAATWFALLLDENASTADYERFRTWLLADERNARAYARIERVWGHAAVEQARPDDAVSRRGFLKITSGIVLLAGTGGTAWHIATRPDFSTGTGEIRSLTLADGSTVELGAASAISVDFTASIRRIVLHGGEAFFSVVPDSRRPFRVEAGSLAATALGTAYAVAIAPERTSVAVTEHNVRVEAGGRSVDLSQGDAIDWQDGVLGSPIIGDAESRVRWRERQLVFLARPLGEVIAEVNRWRKGRLFIPDAALAARRVTAILDVNDIDGIDATLEQGLPISLQNYTSLLTIVTTRK